MMMIREHTVPIVQMTILDWVSGEDRAYVLRKMEHLLSVGSEPVLGVHLIVRNAPDPHGHRPPSVLLQAELSVHGDPVRAHVAASSVREGADLLQENLRNRLARRNDRALADRRHHKGEVDSRRVAQEVDAGDVSRRKTFAVHPMSCAVAAEEMSLLGHDFYLYLDRDQGKHAVVHRVAGEPGETRGVRCATADHAPVLTLGQAIERLNIGGEPFVFYQDADEGQAQVLYRRRAGDLGLITPAALGS